MSVLKNDRGEAEPEFLHTARELHKYSIQKCVSFPKRYTFYVSQPIAQAASRIHEYVKMANSVYPTNPHEVQIRIDYFIRANSELHGMVSLIEVAKELFGIEPNVMELWMGLVDKEIRLVKGALKSDRARYKKLFEPEK